MAEDYLCPICRTALPSNAPAGFCPTCELRGALDCASEPGRARDSSSSQALPSTISELVKIRYFGDYELLEEIARGGMGTVFKARQVSLNRLVALKLISSGVLASHADIKRFKAEAEATAGLDHPHIVPIHEIGEADRQLYFSMTFIDGPTLGQTLGRKSMPTRQAAQLLVVLSHAVHFAHQRGVLHRDIKPSNILLDAQGEPHLTDFGLAKFIQRDAILTHTNVVLGTPAYMSPEQARGESKEVTTAADIYGLGAVLYETLTGTPPFAGGTSLETIRQVLEQEPRRPSIFNSAVDRDLETICLKCLEKISARRYETALALAEDLERWLRHEPILARPTTAWAKLGKWIRRKPAMAASLATTGLLLLVMAIGGPVLAWRIAAEHKQVEQSLYVADVRLASEALARFDIVHARERLQRIAASPSQRALRGWEYRYLVGRCQSRELMLLGRHDSWVSDVAISSDDRWAASISEDGIVKLWDFATRKEARSWTAHKAPPKNKPEMLEHALTFSPDGQTLATGGRDQAVRLWNVNAPLEPALELEPLDDACTDLAFSADGTMLASTSLAGQVSLWSVTNKPPLLLQQWTTLNWGTMSVAFSLDGKTVLVSAPDQARFWDISEPESPRPLPGFAGTIGPAGFSPDGRCLVAADSGGHFLRGWDYATRRERPHWSERPGSLIGLAFSSDGQSLASGLLDGEIVVWAFEGQGEPVTFTGHEDLVSALAFSHGGQLLISASWDKTVRLWDVGQKETAERAVPHGISAAGLCFSPDSRYLASVAMEHPHEGEEMTPDQHRIKLWEVNTLREITNAPTGGSSWNSYPKFTPDGHFLVSDDWGRRMKLFQVPSLQLVTTLTGLSPGFAHNTDTLFYASRRRMLQRPSPAAPNSADKLIAELSSTVLSMAVSPDGSTVAATCEADGGVGIQFWDTRQRRFLGAVQGHDDRPAMLAFSNHGTWLASAGFDGKVGIWDVARRRLIQLLSGHSGSLYCVAFSPDDQTVASCGEDATVRLWSTTTLEEVGALRAKSRLSAVAFSPDGQWLAAAANNAMIHVWRAPLWAEIEAAEKTQARGR